MAALQPEQRVQPVRRNMRYIRPARRGDQDIPVRTADKNSPMKQSAGNKHPSENHTRDVVDGQMNHELTKARYRSLDLADLMFGDLVTTNLARDILERFLADGTVICKEVKSREGEETRHALQAAYANAVAHACLRSDVPPDETSESETKYHWSWANFPPAPINENKLVAFLNSVADHALSTARSILGDGSLKPMNRFVVPPMNKKHGIPLSYEPDGEDMRPDFIVLPLVAFSDDEEPKVNEAYVNFTAVLLAGESKSARNARDGLTQVQRYMRGIKRAQPWLRFATGMAVGKDFVALLRGDCSGIERTELSLTDGRGCIEFIRIVLGIVLADKQEFGHNRDVEIGEKDVSVDVPGLRSASTPHTDTNLMNSDSASQSVVPPIFSGSTSELETSCSTSSGFPNTDLLSATSRTTSSKGRSTSTGSKRGPDDVMKHGRKSKSRKRTVTLRAFIPVRVHGRECMGILFTSGSIRGRGTTVYVVVAADDGKTYLALKTSWQDVTRAEEQTAVLKRLSNHGPHPNVIIPSRLFDPMAKDGRVDSTLGSIRALLDDEMQQFQVENRVLTVTMSDLRRPVAYFWSPHDFVRGVVGALLGHQYLCEIGILHRDISENNIVLSLCRGGLGALIDFDMAIVGRPNMHKDPPPPPSIPKKEILASLLQPSSPLLVNDKPYKAQRTGTTPYMSIGVLRGEPHTHYDDIESFLYVLVLFFLSYKGPLEKEALRKARAQGFIQQVGAGRLPHVTSWPDMFERWASGSHAEISRRKAGDLNTVSHTNFIREFYPNICSRWESGSQSTAPALADLILDCWMTFSRHDLKVAHSQFIELLQEWLTQYAGDESNYVYPFDD